MGTGYRRNRRERKEHRVTIRKLGELEFIALIAMMFASIAFSVDTMLPALPEIGDELSPLAPNNAQFVVTSFVLGMGLGTLVVGPISDAYGRKPVILATSVLYFFGAYVSYAAATLEVLIGARILMGIGAAVPRAVGLAIVRDLYSGRKMAQIMSFAMTVFALVPALAPLAGSFIIDAFGWREVFLAFMIFMAIVISWYSFRQPETPPQSARKPLKIGPLWAGVVEIFANRVALGSILTLTMTFGILFATLVSIQPVFDITFEKGESFPWWFFLTSILAMTGSLLNARYVQRLGMRYMVNAALTGQVVFAFGLAVLVLTVPLPEPIYFALYYIWATSIFWIMGLTIGNLNALALEPMGHIAGLAASVVSASGTVLSILVAIPIGLAFDGTPVPIMIGVGISCAVGLALMRLTKEK